MKFLKPVIEQWINESVKEKWKKIWNLLDDLHYHVICIQTMPCKTEVDGVLRDAFQMLQTTKQNRHFFKKGEIFELWTKHKVSSFKNAIEYT